MTSRNHLLSLLALGHGATHWHQGAMSVCLPLILRDLGMSYTQMGAIRSFQRVAIILSTTAGGLATDLLNQRKAILIFSVLWPTLIFYFQGYMNSFAVFAALVWLRALFGGFLWHTPARAAIGEAFPDRMGFGLGIHTMGGNLGQALAPLAVGGLLYFVDWRTAIKLHLVPGLLVVLLLWGLLPPMRQTQRGQKGLSYLAGFRAAILRNKPFLGITLVGALRSIGENLIPTFLPLYLANVKSMSAATIGIYLSSLAIVGTVAAPVVGHLSDRLGRKRTLFGCLISGGILVGAIPLADSAIILFTMISLAGVVIFSVGPIIQAAGLDYAPRELWGASQSFMDINRAFLSLVFPLIAGVVADFYGLSYTFYLFGIGNLIAASIVFIIPRRAREMHDRSPHRDR